MQIVPEKEFCVCARARVHAAKGSCIQVKQSSAPKGGSFHQASVSEHVQGDQFVLGLLLLPSLLRARLLSLHTFIRGHGFSVPIC